MLIRQLPRMLWIVLAFGSGTLQLGKADVVLPKRPTSLEIVSVPWDIQTRAALTEETILTISAARHLRIIERRALEEFQERLRGLAPLDPADVQAGGAIRVLARFRYTDGSMQRLSIPESCGSMIRDGVRCSLEMTLFRWLASRLSRHEQDILHGYPACPLTP